MVTIAANIGICTYLIFWTFPDRAIDAYHLLAIFTCQAVGMALDIAIRSLLAKRSFKAIVIPTFPEEK